MSSTCHSDSVRYALISVRTTTEPQPSTPSPTAPARNCSAASDWKTFSSRHSSDRTSRKIQEPLRAPDESDRLRSFTLKLLDVSFRVPLRSHVLVCFQVIERGESCAGLISPNGPRWQSNNVMTPADGCAQDEASREIFVFGPFRL